MKIAVAAELAPAKSIIPVIKRLDAEILGLAHGIGADELLMPYCNKIKFIGQGRGAGSKKRSNSQLAYLVMIDIFKTINALRGEKIDLLLTCGNAGDVRKGLAAANILRIPTLHIEQDIYNPIELIAFADIITAPSENYKKYLQDKYGLTNIRNIGGYPLANFLTPVDIMDKEKVHQLYGVDEFILLALGGDLKIEDLPNLINAVESLEKSVLIAPFRFDRNHIKKMVNSSNIKVLEGFVDLPSIMNASSAMIYGAGMGMTIEAAVLNVPCLKIAGFHRKHASVDLATELGIKIVEIKEIPQKINDLSHPQAKNLLKNSKNATDSLIKIIETFKHQSHSKGGYKSLKRIWDARSKFR
ncbi:hypothetical protein [Methanobacterium alcaliphilum]|uniref:hypothetical protein n=1 Tax=Methanobacterium alcaliphilum TaxID=392018 RepID=UPI00200A42A1|nr:hypothetical protein [Methanobacterium alcaliphilum]MCK9151174.1 hypothetical protein [Methanobacterium alcaliphilum]